MSGDVEGTWSLANVLQPEPKFYTTSPFYLSNYNPYYFVFSSKFHIYIFKFLSNNNVKFAKVLMPPALNLLLTHAWPTQVVEPPSTYLFRRKSYLESFSYHHIHIICQSYQFYSYNRLEPVTFHQLNYTTLDLAIGASSLDCGASWLSYIYSCSLPLLPSSFLPYFLFYLNS